MLGHLDFTAGPAVVTSLVAAAVLPAVLAVLARLPRLRDRHRGLAGRIAVPRHAAVERSRYRDIAHDSRRRPPRLPGSMGPAVAGLYTGAVVDAVSRQAPDERCTARHKLPARGGRGMDH